MNESGLIDTFIINNSLILISLVLFNTLNYTLCVGHDPAIPRYLIPLKTPNLINFASFNTIIVQFNCQCFSLFLHVWCLYAVKAQTSLAPLSRFRVSRVTTAHAHQCCIFQSYAKTVPSRMKLAMKVTMREPTFMGSMTTDTWSRRVTSGFNSVL